MRVRGHVCAALVGVVLLALLEPCQTDTTLETDTEALAQMFFALGGPSWHRRDGWDKLEAARDLFDDVFDTDGDEVLTLEEFKRGLNVAYVGCAYPPCFPSLRVHNPMLRLPEPDNRFALEEYGFFDEYLQPFVDNALRNRIDPVRGVDKVDGRDASIDGMLLFKEFFSNFIAADPCNDAWHGLACSDQGRVTGVSLLSNHLTGTIPPDIGNLTFMKGLLLGSSGPASADANYIIGELPTKLGDLYQLETLVLDHNLLSGSIPASLGTLRRLSLVDLSYNHLEGPLPDLTALGGSLQALMVQRNFLNGTLDGVSVLRELRHIDVRSNEFEGDLQAPLGNLQFLRKVFLQGNENATYTALGGSFHAESDGVHAGALLSQDKAVLVDLWQQAGGEGWFIRRGWEEPQSDPCLSYWFGVFCDDHGRLTALDLTSNNVSGALPRSVRQLAFVKSIRLSNNALRGTIPPEIGELKYLRTLKLDRNLLDGAIPQGIGKLMELEELDLSDNYLSGPPPAVQLPGGLGRLLTLNLKGNRLTGALPPSVRDMYALRYFDASENRLGGGLPRELWHVIGLRELRLSFNLLGGELPKEWGQMERLRTLDLHGNRLEGLIPQEWGEGFKQMRFLSLGYNRLQGTVPSTLFLAPRLEHVALSNNRLDGRLPNTLRLVNATLTVLSLGNNQLTGPIPSSFARLPMLTELDISNNRFYGFLPEYMNVNPDFQRMGHTLRLGGNDLACPIPHFAAAESATCTTRNCPLGWVSDGKDCYQCRPGYHRDAYGTLCSRCPTYYITEEHPTYGLITDKSCAVFRGDLKGLASAGNGESDRYSIKCMPCRIAQLEQLKVVAEESAEDLKVGRGYQVSQGRGVLKYNGSSVYADGTRYTGEWRDGAPHGRGTMTLPEGMYVGMFRLGKKHGIGTFSTPSGDMLSGEWGDDGRFFDDTSTLWSGVLSGKGFARYRANAVVALRALEGGLMTVEQVGSAGGTYEGDWMDGEWHGIGAFSAANGDVYVGDLRRGRKHGRGLLEYRNSDFYKGGWVNDQREGNGTMYYANGDIYEGGWKAGRREGFGVLWTWFGYLYEGYWIVGLQQGWGRETMQRTGEIYEGQWLAGLKNGFGVIHYGNSDSFHGYFVDGRRQGDGIYHCADVTGKDIGFNLKAGYMFDQPRSNLEPIIDTVNPDVSFSVPRSTDNITDDNLQYWGDRSLPVVGEGYTGSG